MTQITGMLSSLAFAISCLHFGIQAGDSLTNNDASGRQKSFCMSMQMIALPIAAGKMSPDGLVLTDDSMAERCCWTALLGARPYIGKDSENHTLCHLLVRICIQGRCGACGMQGRGMPSTRGNPEITIVVASVARCSRRREACPLAWQMPQYRT